MRKFTIAAATVAIAALISAAPASADRLDGGPVKKNGQWKPSKGAEGLFGSWRECALAGKPALASKPASASNPATQGRRS